MSAIGKGDWVQVVHGKHDPDIGVELRAGDVHCVGEVDHRTPLPGMCPFDGCEDPGIKLVGIDTGGGWFCVHRFRPLGGGGATVDRRELADA